MKLKNLKWIFVGTLVVWSAAGCGKTDRDDVAGGGNSETHFLEECTDKCPGGLSCVCGVCTSPCAEASDCGGLSPNATCMAACTTDQMTCDVPCGASADCAELGRGAECVAGRCRFGDGNGTGSLGPFDVTDAVSFRHAVYGTYCEKIFDCEAPQDDDSAGFRLQFQTKQRCFEVLTSSELSAPADRDLDAKLAAGTVELRAAQVNACLEALADCDAPQVNLSEVAACRTAFRGSSPLGGPCARPEDCADDVACAMEATCPGTCTRVPLVALGESCNDTSECDTSSGDVECVGLQYGYGYSCELVTRFPPAGAGKACSFGYGTEVRPCAAGASCRRPEGLMSGTVPGLGACQAPSPLGAACGDTAPPCADGSYCIDGSCQSVTLNRRAGAPCGGTAGCDMLERLACTDGTCQVIGDGSEGSPCQPFDLHAFVDCGPGLICLDPDPSVPSQPGTPSRGTCGKPRAAGGPCVENDDCASQHCRADGTCGDTYCCDDYSCQTN